MQIFDCFNAAGDYADWLRSTQLKYQFYAPLSDLTGQQIKSKSRYELLEIKTCQNIIFLRKFTLTINTSHVLELMVQSQKLYTTTNSVKGRNSKRINTKPPQSYAHNYFLTTANNTQ